MMRTSTLGKKIEIIICIVIMILALVFLIAAINYTAKNVWAGYISWSE
jgi:hypothetical protein